MLFRSQQGEHLFLVVDADGDAGFADEALIDVVGGPFLPAFGRFVGAAVEATEDDCLAGVVVEETDHHFVPLFGPEQMAPLFAGVGHGQARPDDAFGWVDTGQFDLYPELFVGVFLKSFYDAGLQAVYGRQQAGGRGVQDVGRLVKRLGGQAKLDVGPPACFVYLMADAGYQGLPLEAGAESDEFHDVQQFDLCKAGHGDGTAKQRHPGARQAPVGPTLGFRGVQRHRAGEHQFRSADLFGQGVAFEVALAQRKGGALAGLAHGVLFLIPGLALHFGILAAGIGFQVKTIDGADPVFEFVFSAPADLQRLEGDLPVVHGHGQVLRLGPREHEVPVGTVVLHHFGVFRFRTAFYLRLYFGRLDQLFEDGVVGAFVYGALAGNRHGISRVSKFDAQDRLFAVRLQGVPHGQAFEDRGRGLFPALVPQHDLDLVARLEEGLVAEREFARCCIAVHQNKLGKGDAVDFPVGVDTHQPVDGLQRFAFTFYGCGDYRHCFYSIIYCSRGGKKISCPGESFRKWSSWLAWATIR